MYTKNILHKPKVLYYDHDHMYLRDDEVLTSVTSFINRFIIPFNHNLWSSYKALQTLVPDHIFSKAKKKYSFMSPLLIEDLESRVDPRKYRRVKRTLVRSWEHENLKACNFGTKYHNELEHLSILRGVETNPFTEKLYRVHTRKKMEGYDNYSLTNDLYKIEDGYYPELLIWNDTFGLAGQADRVFIETIGKTRYIDIDDYKTNKKITTGNDFFSYMKPPIHNLPNTKVNLYSLQISIYAYMLEQFGFTIRNLSFHHFEDKYPVKYMKDLVYSMLTYVSPECLICSD